MNYDVGIYAGHGLGDPGACHGNYKESEITKQIVDKIVALIGSRMKVHTGQNNYQKNYTESCNFNTNYAMSIHINSGGGYGSEAIVPLGEKHLDTEVAVLNELSKLGFKNRGIKSRDYNTERFIIRTNGAAALSGKDYYKEIRQAWSKTSLTILEVGFIDTTDINLIQKNIDEIAFIIAKELCALKKITLTKPCSAKTVYRIIVDGKQVGAYSSIPNIVKELEKIYTINKPKKVEITKV